MIRKLVWPAAMTLAMLLVLLALGTWQVHRLAWKEDLLSQIAHAEAAPPVPLKGVPPPFEKVEASGRLQHDKSALYGADAFSGVVNLVGRPRDEPNRSRMAEGSCGPPFTGIMRVSCIISR